MLAETTDADLVREIGNRSREAEAEFCRRMWPRIRLYGLRHLRSATAAEDLARQVLVTALEALRAGRLREPARLAAFVMGISRMTAIDGRRSAKRRERLLDEFGSILVAAPPAPSLEVDLDRLARCVQALKERERSVVVLTFYDEQGGADAAASLGISCANVRVIRHRAVRQLRACMEVAA